MPEVKLLAEWFWTDRWMGSSGFLLPQEARGVYREMLTQAWRREAKLPNDHEAIRRATGTTPAEWRRAWPLIGKYWRVEGGDLVNDTQLLVYAEAKAAAERASQRGQKGGKASAQVRRERKSGSTQVQHEHQPPDPSPEYEDQDQNKPALKTRRASRPVENRNAADEPSPDRDAPTLRDCAVCPSGGSDDRRLRVEGADEGPALESGLRLSEPGPDGSSTRAGRTGDAEGSRAQAGESAGASGAAPASTARSAVAGPEAGGVGSGRADAGRRVSGWSKLGDIKAVAS